jgi:hypothetical protein
MPMTATEAASAPTCLKPICHVARRRKRPPARAHGWCQEDESQGDGHGLGVEIQKRGSCPGHAGTRALRREGPRHPSGLSRPHPPQVGLIVLVALLMPRAGPSALDLHTGATSSERRFAVVIDAGSTGSRVHAFEFAVSGAGHLELLNDHFTQLKPGLSSFAADPATGAASLKPLLEAALAAVPPLQAAVTPIEVRATAGLRLLPGAQAEQLLLGERALCYPVDVPCLAWGLRR